LIIIRPINDSLSKGAIVPNDLELAAIIHALGQERDRIKKAEGNQYGLMTIDELEKLIADLADYQRIRGA